MFKKKIYQSITITMAFLILLSSVGYGFVEHQCLMSGKSVRYISNSKAGIQTTNSTSACCAKPSVKTDQPKTYFTKTDCCKVEHKFHKAELVTIGNAGLLKSFVLGTNGLFWANKSYVFLNSEWSLPHSDKLLQIVSFSSRYHGKTMRFFIQSFLI